MSTGNSGRWSVVGGQLDRNQSLGVEKMLERVAAGGLLALTL
jgi:hypothetical protein